ncbi:restriction endonuclease subunit S [Xanthomonas campestris]|uniref:restriction endonuclease subunit S n=1 Tax=Xanthomonas TaxID=338 RepID=UPI001E30898A|nr:restriction endonuclease subunit S [Xanthomonas campestris]MCC5044991.1 restriction endonuclease subunit S [Xanthomonas campestris]
MLPDGWVKTTVGKSCTIRNTLRFPLNATDRANMPGEYPYFGPTGKLDAIDHYRIDEPFALIGEDGDHFLKFRDRPMTLYFDGKANVNNHAHIIGDSKECLAKWFYYCFMHRDLTATLSRQGVGRYKLTKSGLEQLELALPPKQEQAAIVEVLSTWDQAIATTERLLKNSQKQMDILLRDLTLGTQRTTSTPSPWAKFTLGELGRTYSGLSGKKGEDFGFGAKFIPYTNVFKNNRIDIEDFSLVKISENENQTRVKSGDIIFTISSETPNEVGMASVLLDDVNELYLNSFCFGYRLNDFKTLLPEYAGFVLRAPHIRALMTQIAQGSTRFNISKANVMRMELALPSIAEQKRIASILGGAHSTVKNLRDQLARLKAEKVILMSQLLTGKRRVRLPTDEAAHA